ncbi:MAG: methyltransferase domain-containing protein [Nitrospira sp.]|nr:methyltransferase domain-containing protein [Nitrospira sp.]
MSARDAFVSLFAGPFKGFARRVLGPSLYQQVRVTFLGEHSGLGLDWRWGNSLRRTHPVRRDFGWQAGQPIDRYYTEEHFLPGYRADIRGRVMEIADDRYTRQFGDGQVTVSDVLHLTPNAPGATIFGSLTNADHIPADSFDCIIVTFTLQFIFDVRAAIRTLARILKPGGVVLLVFPGISQISRYDMDHWGDFWRFTSLSTRRLFEEAFHPEDVTVKTYGNVLAATASLHGLIATELRREELDHWDRDYELVIGVRAVKR